MRRSSTPRVIFSPPTRKSSLPLYPDASEKYKDHLSLLCLARGGTKAFKSLDEDWLNEEAKWPTAVQRRIYRYMHSHDLYQVIEQDDERFVNLVDSFIIAASLPEKSHVRRRVVQKCRVLINKAGDTWVNEGVLVEVANTKRKTIEFQKVWDNAAEAKTGVSSPEQTPSLDFHCSPRMSRCSSVSTSRRLSDDINTGKRAADEDVPTRPEEFKRMRRSISNPEQEEVGDFIVVYSGKSHERANIDPKKEDLENNQNPLGLANAEQANQSIGVGLGRELSTEDAESIVQKATDAWHALRSTKQASIDRDSDRGSAFSTSLADPTPSPIHGSTMSPATSHSNYPPPSETSQRESGYSSGLELGTASGGVELKPSNRLDYGSPRMGDLSQFRAIRSGQVSLSSIENSVEDREVPARVLLPSAKQETQANSQITPLRGPRRSHGLDHILANDDAPFEDKNANTPPTYPSHGIEQLPGSQLPNRPTRDVSAAPEQRSSQLDQPWTWPTQDRVHDPISHSSTPSTAPESTIPDASSHATERGPISTRLPSMKSKPGSFNTFPSNFSVTTTESIQKGQNLNKSGRRRGQKLSNNSNEETKQGANQRDFVKEDTSRPGENSSQDGARFVVPVERTLSDPHLRAYPPAPNPQAQVQTLQPSVPTAPTHHTLPPRPSITPPPPGSVHNSQEYRPPAVVFTIDNRAESVLVTADVQAFIENFTRGTTVILSAPGNKVSESSHPIGVIMWQSLPDFYKWYTEITGIVDHNIGSLRFELLDIHWQHEKSFVVPHGNLNYFRTLKQYIWDFFWVSTNLNKGPALFRVMITSFLARPDNIAKEVSAWSAVNPKVPDQRNALAIENAVNISAQPATSSPQPDQPLGWSSVIRNADEAMRAVNREEIPIAHPAVQSTQVLPPSVTLGYHSSSIPAHQPSDLQAVNLQSGSPSPHFNQKPVEKTRPRGRPPGIKQGSQASISPLSPHLTRTSRDTVMLRDRAHAFMIGRDDIEIHGEESTVNDRLPYKYGAEVCGGVIDKKSGKGLVSISGKGYITNSISTGPDEVGERYQEVIIQPKQTCMLHGGAVILYFRRKQPPAAAIQQPPRLEPSSIQPPSPPADIVIRVQVDGTGKFSNAFDKSYLRPKLTTEDFFGWFATQTGRNTSVLKFTFKDAMPTPKATEITKGNEDHFTYMRKDIKTQCEKAKRFMPDLKEFVVLISVPGWISPDVEEDEDW